MERKHGFLIGGTHSGCGKTTIALGLMAAFRARGFRVQPFKVGPDFIDPGLHTVLCGRESRNLDGWMLGREYNRTLFRRLLAEADVAIVEGVMGIFDGYEGSSEAGSSAEMAKLLGLPALLVVDARSMARSVAALVYGFSHFDPALRIAGVIFNRIGGEGHLGYLREAMSEALPQVPVLGGIPKDETIELPERHLGLVTADETEFTSGWREKLVRLVERHLDLDLLLEKMEYLGGASIPVEDGPPCAAPPVPVAVARDAAFCFYYPDNLELLRREGANLQYFSPTAGETLPVGAAGLYLGGGYPELFAGKISNNGAFIDGVRVAASKGMPVYAECGGLMVLGRFIETLEGTRYPMAGILPFGTRMLKRRKALGYTETVLRRSCLLGEAGVHLRGHEFHYSEIVEEGKTPGFDLAYELRARKFEELRLEGYSIGSVLASYIHQHWGSAPTAPAAFLNRCRVFLHGAPVHSTGQGFLLG